MDMQKPFPISSREESLRKFFNPPRFLDNIEKSFAYDPLASRKSCTFERGRGPQYDQWKLTFLLLLPKVKLKLHIVEHLRQWSIGLSRIADLSNSKNQQSNRSEGE